MNFILVILFCITVADGGITKLPDFIKTCQEDDPNIKQCILNSILHLKHRMKTEIPELDMFSLEPILMDDIRLNSQWNDVDTNLTKLKVFGVSDFEIEDLRVDIKETIFKFKIKLPFLQFIGVYQLKMRFLFLNLESEGDVVGNLTDYRFVGVLKGNKIKKGGNTYLEFERMHVNITAGKVSIHLYNLFNRDTALSNAANKVINEYSDFFVGEIKPGLENSIALKCTDIANKITSSFAYEELFPR